MKNVFGVGICISALLLALACAKSSDAGGTGSEVAAGGAAQPVVDLHPAAVLPEQSAGIIGFSVQKFVETELFKAVKPLLDQGLARGNDPKALCDLDPYTEITAVVISLPRDGADQDFAVILTTAIDEAKATKCMVALGEKMGETIEVKKTGNIVSFVATDDDETAVNLSWLPGGRILMTFGDAAVMEARLTGDSNMKKNAALMELLGKVDTTATMWGAADLAQLGASDLGLPAPPTALYGTAELGKAMDGQLAFRFADGAAAQQTTDMLKEQLAQQAQNPMMGSYLQSTYVTTDGNDSVVRLKLTEEQLTSLSTMLGGMLPMMMGGGGE